MTTTSVTVETWIKGQGPSSMSLSELNLTETEDEVAQVESGRRYVLFLEEVPYGSGVRHILVGGGAYEIGHDGRLSRVDASEDTFPKTYASLDRLTEEVRSAPTSWTATP